MRESFAEMFEQSQVDKKMRPGDVLLLLSDGIWEAHREIEDPFGIERTLEVVQSHRHLGAAEIAEALRCAARAHSGQAPHPDDMTVVVVKREEEFVSC